MYNQSGQTMLLTVLIMSGVMLSATVIGSYLILNQVRQSTFSANSVQALAAADSGIECELYNLLKSGTVNCNALQFPDAKGVVSVKTTVTPGATSTEIDATGGAASTFRAFQVIVGTGP